MEILLQKGGVVIMATKVPKRKFKIIGWRAAKRLDEMTTAELITMRDRAHTLSFSYANCERVSDYWARIEEICQKLIEEQKAKKDTICNQ